MHKLYRCLSLLFLVVFTLIAGCASVRGFPEQGVKSESASLGLRLRVTPADTVPGNNKAANSQMLQVIEVKSGQSAEAAGINIGDILLELNGEPVSGMADSVAILQNSRWGDVLSASIMRGKQIFLLPIALKRQHLKRQHAGKSVEPQPTLNPGVAEATSNRPVSALVSTASDLQTDITDNASDTRALTIAKVPAMENQLATVVVDRANVRIEASTSSKRLVSLRRGARVMITDEMGGWFSIVTQGDRKIPGYIHGSLVAQ